MGGEETWEGEREVMEQAEGVRGRGKWEGGTGNGRRRRRRRREKMEEGG